MKSVFATLLAALACASTFASPVNSQVGPYMAVSAAMATLPVAGSLATDKPASAITLGVNLNSVVGFEVSQLNVSVGDLASFNPALKSATGKATSIALVTRGTLLGNSDLSLKLGYAHTEARVDGTSGSLAVTQDGYVAGLAVDYRLSRNWSVGLAVDLYPNFAGTDDRLRVVSSNVKFRF